MKCEAVKPRVLHVDDDKVFCELFSNFFDDSMCITSHTRVSQAIEDLKNNKYDAVITDYEMPEMNGIEFLKTVKEIKPTIPVILCTGQGNEGIARESFLHGAYDYFTKDLLEFAQFDRIKNSIKKAISTRKAEDRLKKSRLRFSKMFNYLSDAAFLREVSPDNGTDTFIDVNTSACKSLGYSREELLEIPCCNVIVFSGGLTYQDVVDELMDTGYARYEAEMVCRDGAKIPVDVSANLIDLDGTDYVVSIARDISVEKGNLMRLRHLNKVLEAIRGVNKLIVREKNSSRLIEEACLLLTQSRGYNRAWIIIFDTDGNPAGFAESGAGDVFESFYRDLKSDRNLNCLELVRKQGLFICDEGVFADCILYQGAEEKRACLGLEINDTYHGLLGVSLPDTIPLNDDEIGLLKEMAGDVAFALHVIEHRK